MRDFMTILLTCSGAMSAVILLYLAFTPLLAKHYSAGGLYYAWLVLAAGLVIPFRPRMWPAVIRDGNQVGTILKSPVPISDVGAWTGNMATLPINTETSVTPLSLPSASPGMQWWQLTAIVWLAGLILTLACQGIKHRRFVKMTNRWSDAVAEKWALQLL